MQKKLFVRKFSKSFYWKDFLEFLLFYLILRLSPHTHLFFQLSSCTGWSTIRDFRIFFDKISSPPLFLTLNRGWECCLTSMVTFQPPPKNWQSSVTKFSMCAFFLADTVCFYSISLAYTVRKLFCPAHLILNTPHTFFDGIISKFLFYWWRAVNTQGLEYICLKPAVAWRKRKNQLSYMITLQNMTTTQNVLVNSKVYLEQFKVIKEI